MVEPSRMGPRFARAVGLALTWALVAAIGCDSASRSTSVVEMSSASLMSQPSGTVLVLDVRTPEEFAEGHVPNATLIPHDTLEGRLGELETWKGRPVVVYCKAGKRAAIAAAVLTRAGFSDVRHLTGDMDAWRAAGLPIEKSDTGS